HYGRVLFPNANVPERKIPPFIQGICEVEQNRKQKTQQRSEDKKDRPLDAALKERQPIHAPACHQPEKSSDRLYFQNAETADSQQVGDAVLSEPEEVIGMLVNFPLIRHDEKQ